MLLLARKESRSGALLLGKFHFGIWGFLDLGFSVYLNLFFRHLVCLNSSMEVDPTESLKESGGEEHIPEAMPLMASSQVKVVVIFSFSLHYKLLFCYFLEMCLIKAQNITWQ